MKIKLLFGTTILLAGFLTAQNYPPKAGEIGTTAIPKDSQLFKAWATANEVVRGRQQINGTTVTYASVGTPANGIGPANGTILSLGDGGTATLTFAKPITNGLGADFAIFENGFISNSAGRAFLELAFVEVSSDGMNFFRFPSVNEYPADFIENTTDQGGPAFATMDARYLHNFAGKYITGFGTPFDLSEVPDNDLLDKAKITHVKIIDVVGTNIEGYRTYDSLGNVAIDPFPTPFSSSGFDLDAVGVIHESAALSVENLVSSNKFKIYPNPAKDFIKIESDKEVLVSIIDLSGKILQTEKTQNKMLNITQIPVGNYLLVIDNGKEKQTVKFLKSK